MDVPSCRFPGGVWHLTATRLSRDHWYARTKAWAELVELWAGGEVATVTPPGSASLVLGGLLAINNWAISRGEQRQAELIGCEHRIHIDLS